MWYEIYIKNEKFDDAYSDEELIKISCELVNAYGVNPDDIKVIDKTRKDN